LYSEADYRTLRQHIRDELAATGAYIDDERSCFHHPDASIAAYRGISDWRKPEPGMLLDLMRHWPVDTARSLMVGDRETDLQAASRAGISGHLFSGGRLDDFIRPLIA
jgi:D-glycero-D-manno-heptose 1,7-bisphosphate phosphatase